MAIGSREKHYSCPYCGGNLSQISPSWALARCVRCKQLGNIPSPTPGDIAAKFPDLTLHELREIDRT